MHVIYRSVVILLDVPILTRLLGGSVARWLGGSVLACWDGGVVSFAERFRSTWWGWPRGWSAGSGRRRTESGALVAFVLGAVVVRAALCRVTG
jgi:hypothetical protein